MAVIEWSSTDLRIVHWSDGATKVFGWTAWEALGRRVEELLSGALTRRGTLEVSGG